MKSHLLSRLLLPILLLSTLIACGAELPDFTQLVRENGHAVVNISTTQKPLSGRDQLSQMPFPDLPEDSPFRDFFERFFKEGPGFEGDGLPSHSLGSGFIVSEDGYILTNTHVVKGADKIIVKMHDQTEHEAKLVGSDRRTDVALLKIEHKDLPVARLGDSDKLVVGEWVIAIGSPFGLDSSATQGIVSALSRSLPSDAYVPFIQTDVAVNPGNSGGPLFNADGEVVGINSQIYSRTGGYMGLSFAIPINIAMQVADQIKRTGHASHGYLGVLIQPVTPELAESFGLERARGALVAKVTEKSPAQKAGIKAGDVITEFNGRPIGRSSELPAIVLSTAVGSTVDLKVMREGRDQTIKVKIEALSQEQEDEFFGGGGGGGSGERSTPSSPSAVLGMALEDLDAAERKRRGLEDDGVLVSAVTGDPAGSAGIRRGDVIVKLNNQPVKNAADLKGRLEKLTAGKPASILLQRGDAPLFIALTPPKEKAKE